MRPQRDSLKKLWAVLGMAVAFMLTNICFSFSQDVKTPADARPAIQEKKAQQPASGNSSTPLDIYTKTLEPLSPVQCGQCHTTIYYDIKHDGGRHKFQCQGCHKVVHAYSPVQKNWQEVMPKCNECHTLPHGEKMADCAACHGNPHAIKRIPITKIVADHCSDCHNKQFEELRKFPSAHTKLLCSACHTTHGFIPNCNACHKSHYEGEDFATCARECHPVHSPREIHYKKDVNVRTCGGCHNKIYNVWLKSPSKHANVSCAACHIKHGYVPACSECHPMPHSKKLHDKFPNCLVCHQDPHDPPVKKRRH